VDYDKNSEVKK
jgi:hypothetical protein